MSEKALTAARELERLLLPGNPCQAEFVGQLAGSVEESDRAKMERLFCSLEMWGGPGSVADVSLPAPAHNARMNALLEELVGEFALKGITYERANMWASAFERWRQMGVFNFKPQ